MEHTPENGSPTINDVGDKMREDFAMLREAAERRKDEIVANVNQLVEQHPLAMVGAAFGVGVVLSGGLVSKTAMRAVWFGGRLYLKSLVRDLVGKAATELFNSAGGDPAFEG